MVDYYEHEDSDLEIIGGMIPGEHTRVTRERSVEVEKRLIKRGILDLIGDIPKNLSEFSGYIYHSLAQKKHERNYWRLF